MNNKINHYFLREIIKLTIEEILEQINYDGIIPSKNHLINTYIHHLLNKNHVVVIGGILEINDPTYGFIRTDKSYKISPNDVYVSNEFLKKYSLRMGDFIEVIINFPLKKDKPFVVKNIVSINNISIKERYNNKINIHFDRLTPTYPDKKIDLITNKKDISLRTIDLLAPCGLGQRLLIVAPPKCGKTNIMHNMVKAVKNNCCGLELIVLLIDERPEEVTEMVDLVGADCVYSSTFDESSTRHVQLSRIVSERAKRMVEMGKNVIIFLDSITRLARAYNTALPSSGKVLTGGIDSNALYQPKKFFGAARNTKEGGSLTIVGTALVDTGSKMDEVIFEEFKGTGNSEIFLTKKLAEKGIYPSINMRKTSTRREELLHLPEDVEKIRSLKKSLFTLEEGSDISLLIKKIKNTESNRELLDCLRINI